MYQYGCLQSSAIVGLPDGSKSFSRRGKRAKDKGEENSNDYLKCEIEVVDDQDSSKDTDQLALGLVKKFERLQVLNKKELSEGTNNLKSLKDPSQIVNNISSNLNIQIFEKQELLEIKDLKKKIEKIHSIIDKETSVLSVEKKLEEELKIKWRRRKESII